MPAQSAKNQPSLNGFWDPKLSGGYTLKLESWVSSLRVVLTLYDIRERLLF
jgi:hypothetical protein